jgi:L-threonylcarbamoyladenylate synthase
MVPLALTAGRNTVAVRMPSHPVALALIRAADRAVAAPSANRFTELSPTTADHVARSLGDRVEMILDGGATHVGIESTVIDLSGEAPVLLRPGTLARTVIEAALGVPVRDPAPVSHAAEARASPGMIERHYAPRARVILVDSSSLRVAIKRERQSARVGALVITSEASGASSVQQLAADPLGYAQALYASLHALDEDGCSVIVVERPPQTSEWAGVNDRLRRASHPAPAAGG